MTRLREEILKKKKKRKKRKEEKYVKYHTFVSMFRENVANKKLKLYRDNVPMWPKWKILRKIEGARIYPEFDVSRSKTSSFYRQISPRSSFPYQLYDAWCLCIFAFIGHPSVCSSSCISMRRQSPPPVTAVEFIYKYYPPEADKVKPFSTENCKILFTCPRFSPINYAQISILYLYASLSKYRMNNF